MTYLVEGNGSVGSNCFQICDYTCNCKGNNVSPCNCQYKCHSLAPCDGLCGGQFCYPAQVSPWSQD